MGVALARTLVVVFTLMILRANSVPDVSESNALLRFKNSLSNSSGLTSWKPPTSPCEGHAANWDGVLCSSGHVRGLQLEGMGLAGTLDVDSLLPLRYLRTLSFMNNEFAGPLPEINKLSALKSLYLSDNRFSGEIPEGAFEGMGSLKKVLLSNNKFTGKIPRSLATLPRLLELRLNGNQFRGGIPNFRQDDLKLVRLENNDLEGPIPESLRGMDTGSFAGNKNLCGPPLQPCEPQSNPPPVQPPSTVVKKEVSMFFVLSMILIVMGIILAIIALAMFVLQWRKRNSAFNQVILPPAPLTRQKSEVARIPEGGSVGSLAAKRVSEPRLIFVCDNMANFALSDLLKASAEILGSGTFGASYKAVVGGQALVVKRYKQMNNVGREEFDEHMRRLGRLSHPNVLPLMAYYFMKEEKLLVTEFVENTCLATRLHGNHSLEEPGLDWPTRLKIVKGLTNGLVHLYAALPMLTIPHGHLKSSNVLLDQSFKPLLTDYALRPVTNPEHAHTLMAAYKSPEYAQKGVATKKTDVWCLGILILEILTGKFPENFLTQGYKGDASLATWVIEMMKEKRTGEVFDREMKGTRNSKAEMIKLLKIGLSCCEEEEERPEISEVADMINGIREDGTSEDSISWNSSDRNLLA